MGLLLFANISASWFCLFFLFFLKFERKPKCNDQLKANKMSEVNVAFA
jgi:hypothetical protein